MVAYYRISDKSQLKLKLEFATKEFCLDNFIKHFKESEIDILCKIIVLADNVNDQTKEFLEKLLILKKIDEIIYSNNWSSHTFRDAYELASLNDEKEIIYLVEDDYIHLKNSKLYLINAFKASPLVTHVTLYDLIDKYKTRNNPYVQDGGENSKVIISENCHWKYTNSCPMTFASTAGILKEDKDIFWKHSGEIITDSFRAFQEIINNKKRILISPIPSLSTHAEIEWLAPFFDYSKI